MASVANYSADQVIAVVAGVPVSVLAGFGPDTFIKVERNNDSFTLKKGAWGEGTRSRMLDHSGKITVTCMVTSAINAAFEALLVADEASPNGVSILPSMIKDNNGNSLWAAQHSWVMKPAALEGKKEADVREWVIECDEILPPIPV